MRKIFLLILVITLLIVNFSLAQESRQPTSSEGKTTFTNIAIIGLNKNGDANGDPSNQGLPGYIEMTATDGNIFYLYIDSKGLLRIASEQVVGYLASPSIVGWADASGFIVGTQSQ